MSNQKQNNRPRGPMGHGMRGGGEKAKDFKGTMKKLFNYIKPYKFENNEAFYKVLFPYADK